MKSAPLVIFLLLMLPSAASADDVRLSLRQAIDTALKSNHLLQAATYTTEAAEHAVAVRRSYFWPRIGFEESAAASNSPTRTFMMKLDQGRFRQQDFQIDNLNHPSTYGDFRTTLQLDVPIFDPAIGANLALAKEELSLQNHSLRGQRQDIALQVYLAFLDIRRAEARASVADEAVRNAAEHVRLAKARAGAGTALKSDELRAKTSYSDVEQQRLTAVNDVKISRMRLALLLGMDRAVVEITDPVTVLPLVALGEEPVAVALRERPDLREAEAEVERSSTGIDLARSSFFPSLYGNASYQLNDHNYPFGRDNDSWMVGVGLRWEIFDGFRRSNEVAKATAYRSAAAAALESRRKETTLQVSEAMLRREEAVQRLEVARNSVADAEESVRLIGRRYENSLATMVDLLDAQSSLNTARTQLVENQTGVARATALALHSAGVFLQEVTGEN